MGTALNDRQGAIDAICSGVLPLVNLMSMGACMQVATIRTWTATECRQSKADQSSPSTDDVLDSLEALLGPDYASDFRPTFLLAQAL